MKIVALLALTVFLMLAGVTLAHQSEDEKKGSSMKDMMQEMMKGKERSEGGMHGMGDMGGMMGMMKMMEQCNEMMKSDHCCCRETALGSEDALFNQRSRECLGNS